MKSLARVTTAIVMATVVTSLILLPMPLRPMAAHSIDDIHGEVSFKVPGIMATINCVIGLGSICSAVVTTFALARHHHRIGHIPLIVCSTTYIGSCGVSVVMYSRFAPYVAYFPLLIAAKTVTALSSVAIVAFALKLVPVLSAIQTRKEIVEECNQAIGEVLQLTGGIGTWSSEFSTFVYPECDTCPPIGLISIPLKLDWHARQLINLNYDPSLGEFVSLIDHEDCGRMREQIVSAVASGKPSESEFRISTSPGRWFLVRCIAHHNKDQVKLVGVFIDITDRKLREREVLKAKLDAEAASRSKDQFLAMLSHELRTPLTPVLAAVSAAIEDPNGGIDLEMMRRNIALESSLIDHLLDMSKSINGVLKTNPSACEVHQLIRDAIGICRSDLDKAGLHCHTRLNAADHWIMADQPRFHQVIWNLVKNAVKFTPGGGSIAISTENQQPGRLTITVNDSGIGIDPELQGRIFHPFERGVDSNGLGLGLAICRSVVEASAGSISVYSAGINQGSTFTIEIATTPEPTIGFNSEPGPATARIPAAPSKRSVDLRILLVEDNEDTLNVLAKYLRRKFHVKTAGGIRTAEAALKAGEFDLIISDLGLPDGSGIELMQIAKRLRPTIRGIAITGYGMEDDLRASHDAGFALHLTKPVGAKEVEVAIGSAMV